MAHCKSNKKYKASIVKLAGQCGVEGGIRKVEEWVKGQGGKEAVIAKGLEGPSGRITLAKD